jgi:hypothetical protein
MIVCRVGASALPDLLQFLKLLLLLGRSSASKDVELLVLSETVSPCVASAQVLGLR